MLLPATPQFRRKRGGPKKSAAAPAPPPAPLVLQSASYNGSGGPSGEALLILTFDRPVDIAAFSGPGIGARDGIINNQQYAGLSATLVGPATVEIMLTEVSPYFESEQTMSATPTTGIVAVDDGGTWEGCTDLPLPFP
jgi:hypothetical protein